MADYRVQILAQLVGFDAIEAKLNALESNPIKVNVQMDTKGSNINKQMEQMASSYTNVGKKAGTNISSGMISGLRSSKVTPEIKKVTGQIAKQIKSDKDLSGALKNLYPDLDNKNINKMVSGVRAQANKLEKEQIQAQKSQAKIQQSINDSYWKQQFQSVGKKSPVLSEMADYYKAQEKEAAQIMKRAEDISQRFSTNDTAARKAKLESQATNYKNLDSGSLDSFNKSLKESEKAYDSFTSNKNLDSAKQLVSSFDDMSNASKTLENNMKILDTQGSKLVGNNKLSSLDKSIDSYMKNNNRIGKFNAQEMQKIRDNLHIGMSESELSKEIDNFNSLKKSISSEGLEGKSVFSELGRGFRQIGQFAMTYGGIQKAVSAVGESVNELKEVDTILTEISKTSDLTSGELTKLGNSAFESASKYGKTATDYLTGVQEMSRSGFYGKKATEMADLSVLTQAAGDVGSEVANSYLLATNAAYNYRGNVEKLNAVLDGQNMITNRNSVSMADMAEATSTVASVAAQAGIKENQLSAMIGTIESRTKLGGSEVGNALKAILVNLQNFNSSKIKKTLDEAGASMTEYVNGAEQLRNPIDILQDLATTYNSLDESDPLRSEILTNIGQKYHANKLAAFLTGMDDYQKMLQDYSEGSGSAAIEAEKSASNWEGSLNKLSNMFTDTVGNIASSGGVVSGINMLTTALGGLNKFTDSAGAFGSIGSIIGLIQTLNGSGKSNTLCKYAPHYKAIA